MSQTSSRRLEVDVAVIGAGSAGMSAYRAAVKQGARTVLIESGEYGTTCARHACMPSKLLIAAANALHDTTLLDGFGIALDAPPRVDETRVLERVRRERDRFAGLVVDEVATFPAADKLRGLARFLSDTVLQVGDDTEVHARASVIATGGAAVIPEEYRVLGPTLVTSDDVFEWRTLPRRLAVVGTGVIAIELGQALSRLGVDVTMFGKGGGIASISDPKVADYALRRFTREFPIHQHAEVHAALRADGRAELRFADAQGVARCETYDFVLMATGRAPNLKKLSLENTSVRCDAHGVPLFDPDTLQCLSERTGRDAAAHPGAGAPIFIAGDANHQRPWLNDASNEGRIAGEGAVRWPAAVPQSRPVVLSLVFCDPGVLMAGQPLSALDPDAIVIGEVSFENQGRSRVTQRNHGLLRVYADLRTGHLLGAEGIAPAGEHLGHLIAWCVQQRMTLDQILTMPFYHPVFEEGLRTALRDAAKARFRAHPCADPSLSDAVGA
ncbi:dihydrolipoyl dehydrogenase [Robbsia sp. Bb-Pol-6]|uniref:Dihydrolipoyl dehydrogenase n=1 Tax=Robbsia betulipollinis TaxID=2981849 RepID=A0ABT3ZMG4_9BURK|nr:dihydrolipoyl dehydrogenase [Robbsia betulipollinis]MCY0387731.1 dihydrolipoyl dehydrogenase [Robbsia betulipollinis]